MSAAVSEDDATAHSPIKQANLSINYDQITSALNSPSKQAKLIEIKPVEELARIIDQQNAKKRPNKAYVSKSKDFKPYVKPVSEVNPWHFSGQNN